MFKHLTFAFLVLTLALVSGTAEAKHRHHHHRHAVVVAHPDCNTWFVCEGVAPSPRGQRVQRSMGGFGAPQQIRTSATILGGRPSGCPHAFCGCGASLHVFGRIIPALNLAANWLGFPRAAPGPGMAAARSGHVWVLEEHVAGNVWIGYDANSGGHMTRRHARSIAGYTIVNPHGGNRYAST